MKLFNETEKTKMTKEVLERIAIAISADYSTTRKIVRR